MVQKIKQVYYDEKILSMLLCIAIIIDYSLTFYFAGSIDTVSKYDFSPFLRNAIESNLLIPYLTVMIAFYYMTSITALKILKGHDVYLAGVSVISMIAITHVCGGLSWLMLNAYYSYIVLGIMAFTIAIALTSFGYTAYRQVKISRHIS
jgi:hypothetical protein